MPLALLSPLLLCETDNCPFCCLILSRYNYIARSSLLLGDPTWVQDKARSDQELVQLIYLPMIPYEARRRVFISQFLNFQFWDFFSQANFLNVCHALFHLENDILHFLLFYVPDRFILC